jgi:hypothetical protein
MDGKLFKTTYQQRKKEYSKDMKINNKKHAKYKKTKDQQCKRNKVKNEDGNP